MHGQMEYYYRGNAKTVTSDKQSMALAVTGQGQATQQYADSVLHASLQVQTPPKAIEDGEPQEEDTGSLLPDDMKETWVDCKQKLQKVTKAMADFSNEAQTILGALAAKPHLAGLVEAVKKQMGLFEPKKMEALSALGLMSSLTDQQEMKEHLGTLQALCEEHTTHIEGFKKGAFKDARLLLKST